jgi:transposase
MEVLHSNCAGLDVHKETVVACSRHVIAGKVVREVHTFKTTTSDLLALSEWLGALGCTHIVPPGRIGRRPASTGSRCGKF